MAQNEMTADDIYSWANWLLVASLVLGVLATGAIVISGNIREERLKREIAATNLRAEQANAEAAKANLELEQLRAPRAFTPEQQLRISEKLKVFQNLIFETVTYPGSTEPSLFSANVAQVLKQAGWKHYEHPGRHYLFELGSGIIVVIGKQGPPEAETAGKVLLDALISEGFSARLGYRSLGVDPIQIAIQIQVGTKY